MNVEVVWDNEEKTIIRYVFEPQWTWDQFYAAREIAREMFAAVPHKVGVIMDTPQDMLIPAKILVRGRKALKDRPEQVAFVTFVIGNTIARTVVNSIIRIAGEAGKNTYIAASIEAARAVILKKLDEIES
jgi:hypothetical protein